MSSCNLLVQHLRRPLVADADIATALYGKGVYTNQNFEALNLNQPQLVRTVMREFKQAGAQILHTHTAATAAAYLKPYNLQSQQLQIIEAACKIAFEVADNKNFVVGSLGSFVDDVHDFRRRTEALLKAGVHGLALWVKPADVSSLDEALSCIKALQAEGAMPVEPTAARSTIAPNPKLANASVAPIMLYMDAPLEGVDAKVLKNFSVLAQKHKVEVLGLRGPLALPDYLSCIQKLKAFWRGPLAMRPSVGKAQLVQGHSLHLYSPDYVGKYAKRFVQAGAQIVGVSSGLGSEHIRGIAHSVKMLSSQVGAAGPSQAKASPVQGVVPTEERVPAVVPVERRSLLGARLAAGSAFVVSVEIVPPHGVECTKFFEHCEALVEGGIEFVNIPDSARAQARMSSMQMAAYVKRNFKLEPIPHFTSRDRNLIGLQADLVGSFVNGVRNVLVVTGDPPKIGNCPQASAVYDVDAVGLTQLVHNMNCGQSLSGTSFGRATEFLIGVALNPMASNTQLEIERLQAKLRAGADFIITQPIYDAARMKSFLDQAGPIKVPIVMGVWPLVSARNAEFLKNEVPGVYVPQHVVDKMKRAGSDKSAALQCGVDMAIETLLEAKSFVQGFQISAPFNRVSVALQVAKYV